MKIVKISVILVISVISSLNILKCAPISVSDAEVAAGRFYQSNNKHSDNSQVSDTKTISIEATDVIAIFSFENGGFVALSLFNETRPVVAYSFEGHLNLEAIPESMMSWFYNAGQRILEISGSEIKKTIPHPEWQEIEADNLIFNGQKSTYLLSSYWGQGCYFNQYCPEDENGPCGHCVTGCVATAFAQIMKYWNYPQYGIGSHTYESALYGTLSANFGETEYIWANMTDDVTSENLDVATLMSHLGIAVEMNYSATSSGASISSNALQEYFKYSLNSEYVSMSDYSTNEWIELLKYEIDNLRPVVYSGYAEMFPDGHAWVCDGYNESDYFHFNWGYGDGSDGFFEMGNFIYPLNNHAVIKIMPAAIDDVKISNLAEPISQTFQNSSTIKVLVENYSLTEINNIPVSYSVNNGTIISETISTPIPALSSIIYEFNTPFDFSQNPGIYSLKIYSELESDTYKDNDTLNTEIENITCADIPYETGFENNEEKKGWITEDSNLDNKKWEFSTYEPHNIYYSGNSNQADDWVFSRCLSLETDKLYKLQFDYKSTGLYWDQNIEIWLGSAINSSSMVYLLDSIKNFNNADYESKEIYFTVEDNNSYYLGFYCNSEPEMLVAALDNISITELSEPDIKINEILSPTSDCELNVETVSVGLTNMSSQLINNIPITYVFDETTIISETITEELQAGESLIYDFLTPIDLSDIGEHTLKVYTSLATDTNNENDTIWASIQNKAASYPPYLCEFENPEEYETYVIEDVNTDNYTWEYQVTGGYDSNGCVKYEYNDFQAADDWLITKCIYLENDYIYKLDFWNKIEDASWPENLEVKMGNSQTVEGMETVLMNLPNLTNTEYQNEEITFPVSTDGYYYFGFRCFSDAQMFNLYLDDIRITIDAVNDNMDHEINNFVIFPNPARDHIKIKNTNNIYNTNYKVEIYNISGQVAIESNFTNNDLELDITNLTKGVYIAVISNKTDKSYYKFVKL